MRNNNDMLVVYACSLRSGELVFGNVDACFKHNPPTIADIRYMEKAISDKYGFSRVAILDWKPITLENTNE